MAAAATSASAESSYDHKFSFILAAGGVGQSCTPIPVEKAIEKSLQKMGCQFQIIKVKGFVKWQVDGAAGPTHAQLTLRRYAKNQFDLGSADPWKKPVYFPLAKFTGTCPSSEITVPFDVTAEGSSDPFWKGGNEGDSVVMFYSLVGPNGSEFKINELEMEVYVRDIGRVETTQLICDPAFKSIKRSRGKRSQIVAENEFKMTSDQYVLTSIKGRVKWKATKGAILKLKLFKGQAEFANSELSIAEIKRDACSGDFTSELIDFDCVHHLKEDVFKPRPREDGDAVILEVQVPGGSALEFEELEVTVNSKPFFEQELVQIVSASPKQKTRAFVVGISKYTKIGELRNAVKDSRAIVDSLKDHGVEEKDIIATEDCNIFELNDAFHAFVQLCSPGDLAFMFFAGHGCAFKNFQCLLARALDDSERKLKNNMQYQSILESSLQVEAMLAKLRAKGVDKHLLLLDCCREFRTDDLYRNIEADDLKGVKPAPFNVSLGRGTTIGYATAPGDLASDGSRLSSDNYRGENGHGLYTEALLKHMHKINTDVDYMLRDVGTEVQKMSNGQQNPYRSSCLNEPDAYLFPL